MSDGLPKTADIGGGRALSYQLTGAGGPTVVLESGLGASSLEWAVLAPRLAETTTVLTYDRAGFGSSTPVAAPHTAMQMAADCIHLLDAIHAPGPYLLVGHSWGGVIARFVTDRIPDRVGGVVLVDATHEALKMSKPLVALLTLTSRKQAKRADSGALARRVAAGKSKRLQMLLSAYPRAVQERFVREYCMRSFHAASEAELAGLIESLTAVAALTPPRVPVVAVTGAKVDSRMERKARAKMTRIYSQLAGEWPSARHVLAPNSGHFVPQHDTDLLLEIVDDEIARCRAAAVQAG
ncbi:MAG TPA: alpha/beta hydrolase [Mycobacteriales bacterium]|nr:alpha/beta hydrolase [Mycobacteriales bacterium]